MTDGGHITQEDLASYAMQNFPVAEIASIRTHLQSCVPCRQELAEVWGDLALVGLGVEQQALPSGARERFLARIGSEARVTSISEARSRRGAGFWIPWMATAALAILAISLGVQNRALNDQLHDQLSFMTQLAAKASRAQQVLEVLTAPTAQRVTLTSTKVPAQPTARATYLPERGGMILLATNMKQLPDDRAYELWVIPADGKGPVPAGLFRPDAVGTATLVLPSIRAGVAAKAFGITIERASGSDVPTSPIIMSGTTGS
jgi:anti-sigma-K factor RskA